MRRALLSLALSLPLAIAPALGAALAEPPPDTLSDAELAEETGGLRTPLGLDVGFGASVRTFVDGTLALETRLTWTDTGIQSQQTVNALNSIGGSPIRAETLQGFVGDTPSGTTTILHDVSADRIASLVINAADNRSIRQETDITLVLPQLADIQQRVAAARMATGIASSVGLSLRDAATR